MYLNHYGLKKKPFDITPDPSFFWLGEKHKEGWAALKYGILENKSFLLLTGDIGTGKTALINLLIQSNKVNSRIAAIPDPDLEVIDFFNILSAEFQMNKTFDSKGEFLIEFKNFLYEIYAEKGKVLLIIDEAQRLNSELLGQIRALSNIEKADEKLINIFFVGQSEFINMLREERNEAVRKRITVSYHLDPLSADETEKFINHRLSIAGSAQGIFTHDANLEIYAFTGGYPRLINIICDHALLIGYSKGLYVIDQSIILECEKDLNILSDKQPVKKEETTSDPIPEANVVSPLKKRKRGIRIGIIAGIIMLSVVIGYLISYFQPLDRSQLKKNEIVQTTNDKGSETEVLKNEIANKKGLPEDKISKTTLEESSTLSSDIKESSADKIIQQADTPVAQNKPPLLPDQKSIIYFNHGSNLLPNHALETLDQIVKFSSHHPATEIVVKGYTDSFGNNIYNKNLSRGRAEAVKKYLVTMGVPAEKINTYGMGSENPIESNETFDGREKNRRVEIELELKSPE